MNHDELTPDLARLERAARALAALVAEIDLGAADASDLAPAVELVEGYVLGYVLPALRDVVRPALLATGRSAEVVTPRGPGDDVELVGGLELLRRGLGSPTCASDALAGARLLARSLSRRTQRERAGWHDRTDTRALTDELEPLLRAAYPDLQDRRARADLLLATLDLA